MKKFTDWLKNAKDYGICSPPMDAQVAVNFLHKYLLGEDWYTFSSTNAQGNTEIVFEILYKYSRKFRKEWKQYKKVNRRKNNV